MIKKHVGVKNFSPLHVYTTIQNSEYLFNFKQIINDMKLQNMIAFSSLLALSAACGGNEESTEEKVVETLTFLMVALIYFIA